MPSINDIATVTITRETRPAQRSAFGTLLIVGDSAVLPAKDVIYLDINAQLVASNVINGKINGVAISQVTYATSSDNTMGLLATEIASFASVDTAVASDNGAVGYDNRITITALNADTVIQLTDFLVTLGASQATITITRVPYRRTQSYTSLAAMVSDGYATTDSEYVAASAFFNNAVNPGTLKIGRKDAGETWAAGMTAIVASDNDWYALSITSKTIADVTAVMDWTETQAGTTYNNKKRFMASSNDTNNLVSAATSDIGYHAANAEYDRSSVAYLEAAGTEYPECARWAVELSKDPGTYTNKFKTTANFTASPSISDGQRAGAFSKYVNVYETYGTLDMWAEGTVGSSEFEDTIRGIDWLESDMASRIFVALSRADKLPYTNAGLATLEGEVRAALDNAIAVGLLRASPDDYDNLPYRVTTKKVSEISATDRANRTVPSNAITFDAKLAGAVHYSAVSGTVSV
jgi:hypothetical protein